MKNRTRLLILFSLGIATYSTSLAQEVPEYRITDWTSPGSRPMPDLEETRFITDYAADSTGQTPSDDALQLALANMKRPGRVFFPAGTYLFLKTIVLPDSILLEGEWDTEDHRPLSLLRLQPGENQHGIRIQGKEVGMGIFPLDSLLQGQSFILVEDTDLFAVGDILRLKAFDDSTLVFNTWAYHSTGQILEVLRISNDTLFFDKPLRRNYAFDWPPEIIRQQPIRYAGVKCLRVERVDATMNQTANIALIWARDCLIWGVESKYCNFSHIDLRFSSRITVAYSHFEEAFNFGGGGKAYGVMLQSGSADCYIYSNTFRRLRHSMILQSGANGNVLAYNYSREPFWTGVFLPSNSAGDLVLHGNWPYMNLFEGNVVQNIVIDNSHDINGPYNTLFRNRAELFGIFMNTSPASDFQNFIGNQVSNTSSPLLGLFALQGQGHFSFGNSIKGQIVPVGTSDPSLPSMMAFAFPSFYQILGSIPPIKADNWDSTQPFIEPMSRYLQVGALQSVCDEPFYEPPSQVNIEKPWQGTIYPNPSSGIVYVDFTLSEIAFSPTHMEVYDLFGRIVHNHVFSEHYPIHTVDMSALSKGIYEVKLYHFGHPLTNKRLVIVK